MAKYTVECYYTTHCTVIVEASSAEEAEDKAWMEAGDGIYDDQIAGNCVHDFAEVELNDSEDNE